MSCSLVSSAAILQTIVYRYLCIWRLVCSTFGMIVEDTKSEANPTYLTEDERKVPVKVLDCNTSSSSFEDCQLDTVDGRCSSNDFINITCKTYTGQSATYFKSKRGLQEDSWLFSCDITGSFKLLLRLRMHYK